MRIDTLLMRVRPTILGGLIAATLFLSACGGSGNLRHESPEDAFVRGMEFYERERYDRAADYFRAVFTYGRQNEFAPDAQYYLGWAHYHNREYILAASEFNRFAQMYRADMRAPEAEFYRAFSYYHQSPGYQLDQTNTFRAIEELQLYINRFPNDENVPEAERMLAELREKLAHKDYETARLYERRGMYEAAAIMYERVFDKYPDSTPWAERALLGAIENYVLYAENSVIERQPERYELAIRNYERLRQLFPDSSYLPEAEPLYRQALSQQTALANN